MIKIGPIEILRIEELCVPFAPPEHILPDVSSEMVGSNSNWLLPTFIDPVSKNLILSFHSWIVRTGTHTILIDSCLGNHKDRPGLPAAHQLETPYIQNLAKAGLTPSDIDVVFCTHLHIDHVGWNTRLENGAWVPTFPRARYLFSRREYEFWIKTINGRSPQAFQERVLEDSVVPIFAAGQAELVEDGFDVGKSFVVESAPGHSPGHCIARTHSGAGEAVFCGDVLHHPLQILYPEINSFACLDAELARATRLRVLSEAAAGGQLLLPAHFGAPHGGRVTTNGCGFAFHPGEYIADGGVTRWRAL